MELPIGLTLVAVLLASDATHLTTDNYFHRLDFWKLFEFALTVLGIDVSAPDSRGSFSP